MQIMPRLQQQREQVASDAATLDEQLLQKSFEDKLPLKLMQSMQCRQADAELRFRSYRAAAIKQQSQLKRMQRDGKPLQ